MGMFKNKISINNDVYTIYTKYKNNSITIEIFNDLKNDKAIYRKDNYPLQKKQHIDKLHSKVVGRFVKTYKKYRGNLEKVYKELDTILSYNPDDYKTKEDDKKESHKTITQKDNTLEDDILLDKDILGIIITENNNIKLHNLKKPLKIDKISEDILKLIFQVDNNKKALSDIIGRINFIYYGLSDYSIIIYYIDDNIYCITISNPSSIGNILKKSEKLLKSCKNIIDNS